MTQEGLPPPDDDPDRTAEIHRILEVIRDFRALAEADAAAGRLASLQEYQERFPGFEAVVADDYARLREEDPPVRVHSSMGPALAGALLREARPLGEGREIAQGGMGAILRVHDDVLLRDLAMKVLMGEDGLIRNVEPGIEGTLRAPGPLFRRFVQEAQITAQLDHPGVVPVHDMGVNDEGRIFFTMKLVRGRTLGEVFRLVREEREGWTLTRALQVLLRLCETLAFAHSKGVIHRDLKPSNVMVGKFGEVYLMDWGLAKVLSPRRDRPGEPITVAASSFAPGAPVSASGDELTRAGAVLGTPEFMSPEQAGGAPDGLDARSDIYSLGAVLYELLAGRAPYHDPSTPRRAWEIVNEIRARPPEPVSRINPRVPPELEAIATKAMERDPARRYSSATEMAEDLYRYLDGRVVRAYGGGPLAELRKWLRRNPALSASLAGSLLLVVGGALAFGARERSARESVGREAERALRAEEEAVRARRVAEDARERAVGRLYAARSVVAAETHPAVALELAIRGAERAPSRETRDALYKALSIAYEARRLLGHDGFPVDGAFSPDGGRIVTWGGEVRGRTGEVFLWDPDENTPLARTILPGVAVEGAVWSPGGDRVLVLGADGAGRIVDAATGDVEATLRGHGDGVVAGDWSPGGGLVVTASRDGTARLWNAATGGLAAAMEGDGGACRTVAFSPDGAHLLMAREDGSCEVWSTEGARREFRIPPSEDPPPPLPERPGEAGAWWVLEGTEILVMDPRGPLRLFDGATGAMATSLGAARWVRPSSDGNRALVQRAGGDPAERFRMWDLRLRAVTGDLDLSSLEESGYPIGMDPGGRRVVLADRTYNVEVRDVATGLRLATFIGHRYSVSSALFHPDGRRIATTSRDRTVRVWDLGAGGEEYGGLGTYLEMDSRGEVGWRWTDALDADGKPVRNGIEVRHLRGAIPPWTAEEREEVADAGFSSDGRILFLADSARLRMLDAATGETLRTLEGDGWVGRGKRRTGVFPGPQGRRLAVSTSETEITVIDLVDGRPVGPSIAVGATLGQVLWDPAGTRLLTLQIPTGTASLWDVATGAELRSLSGHSGFLLEADIGSGGKRAATAAMDTTVRVWDLDTGSTVAILSGLPMKRNRVALHPDGTLLATATREGCYLFDIGREEILARIPAEPHGLREVWFRPGDPDGVWTVSDTGIVRRWPLEPLAEARRRRPCDPDEASMERVVLDPGEDPLDYARDWTLRYPTAWRLSAIALRLLRKGRPGEARTLADRALELRPDLPDGHLASASLRAAEAAAAPEGSPSRASAVAAALDDLEAAVERGLDDIAEVEDKVDLTLLRDHPRYGALVERMAGGR